jgi:hypothetical protein
MVVEYQASPNPVTINTGFPVYQKISREHFAKKGDAFLVERVKIMTQDVSNAVREINHFSRSPDET